MSRLRAALTTVRGVNKTDVLTIAGARKTAAAIMSSSIEDLSACPGLGPTKIKRLHDAFHEPFRRTLSVANGTQHALPAATQPPAGTQKAIADRELLLVEDQEVDDDDGEGDDTNTVSLFSLD